MRDKQAWSCAILISAAVVLAAPVRSPAETLPAWSPGSLDIHHISTGRGNATFFILPDGTTLLVDAGDAGQPSPYATARPDDSRAPGEWIARYIKRVSPKGDSASIDYAIVTHFHGDHMGFVDERKPWSGAGAYRLSGLTEVAEHVPIRTLLDRGWPDYDYPAPLEGDMIENYRAFIDWQSRNRSLRVERFLPGRRDQVVLKHDPEAYPTFEIRNLTANGEVWTGVGDVTRQQFPPLDSLATEDWPSENMCSISFRLSYGPFDYFTGGDLAGIVEIGHPEWQNVETAVAKGLGPVEVYVVNHHGSIDPASPFFLATLRPRVDIIPAWAPTHPAPSVLKRLLSERAYPGPRDVFILQFREPTKATIGPRAEQVQSDGGHVVVRVAPRGETFEVLVLDDGSESSAILSRHGPYPVR